MANQTIQNSIDYVDPFIEYWPISAGTNNEPAITIANEIQNLITGPPFTWAWNRNENTGTSTTANTQDYTVAITDFGFLERLTFVASNGDTFEAKDIYNNLSRGVTNLTAGKGGRPTACCVLLVTYGTNAKFRLMGAPDQAYAMTFTYQKLITPMSALTGGSGTWTIPPQYSDIYNNLFLGEAKSYVGDADANVYRARGVAALLAKAEGLTDLQVNAFLEQYWARVRQSTVTGLKAQQGTQARGV